MKKVLVSVSLAILITFSLGNGEISDQTYKTDDDIPPIHM